MSLLSSLLLACVCALLLLEVAGGWGTATRRKRAAERDFSLPGHTSSGSAKSFEELQAEAKEFLTASLDSHHEAGGKPEDAKRPATSEVKDQIEQVFRTLADQLEEMMNSPDFLENVSKFLTEFLSLHSDTEDTEKIRSVFEHDDFFNSMGELKSMLPALKKMIPTFADFIIRDLSADEIETLLKLDLSELSAGNISPDIVNVIRETFGKHGVDPLGGQNGVDDLQNFFSSMKDRMLSEDLNPEDTLRNVLDADDDNVLAAVSGEILSNSDKYMDDFRQQLREFPMLADMAGVSMSVINDDKKWKKFVKSLTSNLELLQGATGSNNLPDVEKIFGVNNPDFSNIMKSISNLEKNIEGFRTPTSEKRKKKPKKTSKPSYKTSTARM